MYFSEHKPVVEIEEKGHTDRNQDKENKRQTKIEKHSDCKCLELILMQRVMIFFFRN